MGHERIGFLPQTKKWQAIVDQLALFGDGNVSVAQIANDTLDAVRKNFISMPYDESVIKALSFLAKLSYSANLENQIEFLNNNGYVADSQMSLFSLMISAQRYISTQNGSLEVNKLAKDAAMHAIMDYQQRHHTDQLSLFSENSEHVWCSAGTGAAFCELARSFFASFTEKHIRYYIDRVAASSISDYGTLQRFNLQLSTQTKEIAEHTFEISKLIQSFSAGWFNKNAILSMPEEKQLQGFLSMSFGKLREELRREADGK
jgi:hypothetical protein